MIRAKNNEVLEPLYYNNGVRIQSQKEFLSPSIPLAARSVNPALVILLVRIFIVSDVSVFSGRSQEDGNKFTTLPLLQPTGKKYTLMHNMHIGLPFVYSGYILYISYPLL